MVVGLQRVVVVIWTAGAKASDYVYAEAVRAQEQRKLVNVRPAEVSFRDIPEPFVRAEGDRTLGEYLSSECVACHQVTGRYEGIPPIVGWPSATFIAVMGEYRAGRRANPIMQTIAIRLSEEEIAALAAYFGSLKRVD